MNATYIYDNKRVFFPTSAPANGIPIHVTSERIPQINRAKTVQEAIQILANNSGGGEGKIKDVFVNNDSVVDSQGIAKINNTILKPQNQWTPEEKAELKSTLSLDGFITGVTELIPENELTINQLHNTYLLTQYQEGYDVGAFYTVIEAHDSEDPEIVTGYKYKVVGKSTFPVGNVSDIRYTLLGGKLYLGWKDPDDIILSNVKVAEWEKTVVVYKSYAENYSGEKTYPATPEDGTILITTSVRNEYNEHPLGPITLSENTIYYVRFFPCTKSGVYTIDTVNPDDNRFSTDNYSWARLNYYLENFGESSSEISSFLPPVGSPINVKYLLKDRDSQGNKVVTRADVLERLEDTVNPMADPIDTQWVIVGYNKTVPRYIKYRKFNSLSREYDYAFVSSIDDEIETTTFRFPSDGSTETKDIVVGDLCERTISAGCRVFNRTYDANESEWTYSDTGNVVEEISSTNMFQYGEGPAFAYNAPRNIKINEDIYDFCGYTMTIQPLYCLSSIGFENNNLQIYLQWNQSTNYQGAIGQRKFPIINESNWTKDQGYYYQNGNEYVAIDIKEEGLSDSLINSYPKDVYFINEFGKLQLATEKYMPGVLKASIDGINPTSNIMGRQYSRTIDGATSLMTSCYEWHPNTVYVTNLYVHYNNIIYKVTTETTRSSVDSPDIDTGHYTEIINLSTQTDTTPEGNGYCIYGTTIPVREDGMTFLERSCYSTGNPETNINMYDGSFYRFWINDKYGYSDNKWKQFRPAYNRSYHSMAQSNGLRLKLAAEKDLLQQIIPAINPTYIHNQWVPYSTNWRRENGQFVWYPTDYFFPLSVKEMNYDSTYDGTGIMSDVYPDNTSRIKSYYLADGTPYNLTSGIRWWLRSPHLSSASFVYGVYPSGSLDHWYASITNLGVCPACAIG